MLKTHDLFSNQKNAEHLYKAMKEIDDHIDFINKSQKLTKKFKNIIKNNTGNAKLND